MANNVQWIKIMVGMFDGESFKKIKRAKIGGEKLRDKLTAVWFELLDLAGKCNCGGALINSQEIPYQNFEDIAIMLDRENDEIELCMKFFLSNGMIEIIEDVYILSNWSQYQNSDKLEEIKKKNRERVAKCREKQKLNMPQHPTNGEKKEDVTDCNVTVTLPVMLSSNSNSYSYITNNNINNNSNNNKVNTNSNKVSNNTYISMEDDPIISINKVEEWFAQIWKIYPNKKNKKQAKETYGKKILNLDKQKAFDVNVDIWKLLVGSKKDNIKGEIRQWKEDNTEMKYIPHFSSWLNSNIEDSDRKNSKKYKSKLYKIEEKNKDGENNKNE